MALYNQFCFAWQKFKLNCLRIYVDSFIEDVLEIISKNHATSVKVNKIIQTYNDILHDVVTLQANLH